MLGTIVLRKLNYGNISETSIILVEEYKNFEESNPKEIYLDVLYLKNRSHKFFVSCSPPRLLVWYVIGIGNE